MKPALVSTDNSDDLSQSRMQRKKKYRQKETRSWIFSLAAAVIIALTLRLFVFEFVRVDGDSMLPTLYTDEYVFMQKVSYWFSGPQHGDIVICSFPGNTEKYVKRVIGVGGDRLRITEGVLYINDTASYDYYKESMCDMDEVTVPDGTVYVMGDNRNNSIDSRAVGALPGDMVLGKAVFVVWPFDNIHLLYAG